eukprot:CAMPEP_0170186988 /NCGR_PEP_ID=MMETSP0040_2-20121228/40640_1 /TAXON_ID=641309 /ORGANISM="Lotharella oceanica, Strain CCMP622" /LENGTH=81 /DNA_ID=CAMNT_0010433889 /DNA_START=78 /DNA_END=319 /DNA_ORIENTATION=-
MACDAMRCRIDDTEPRPIRSLLALLFAGDTLKGQVAVRPHAAAGGGGALTAARARVVVTIRPCCCFVAIDGILMVCLVVLL